MERRLVLYTLPNKVRFCIKNTTHYNGNVNPFPADIKQGRIAMSFVIISRVNCDINLPFVPESYVYSASL